MQLRAQSLPGLGAAGDVVSVTKRFLEELEDVAAESAAQAAELQSQLNISLMLGLKSQQRMEVTHLHE